MRGAKSLSNNNNALYVIDGIPMPTLQTTQPSDIYSGMGQSGDGISMINPEDIESMSVLSGAAASALYGSDAQNGVIMTKTKRGTEGRTSITYSNNTSFFSPFVTPEFQNTYGAATGEFSSWGSRLSQPSSYDPMDFFRTGYNIGNSVSLSTGTANNQTFLSLASTNAEGIVPNNTLNRYNIAIRNTSSMFKDKLHLDLSAMYMNIAENNMISEGQYMNPIIPVYLMSPSYSLDTYQMFEVYNASRDFKTQFWPWGTEQIGMQNPYWIINRDNLPNHKNRFMTSAGLTFDIAKGIACRDVPRLTIHRDCTRRSMQPLPMAFLPINMVSMRRMTRQLVRFTATLCSTSTSTSATSRSLLLWVQAFRMLTTNIIL